MPVEALLAELLVLMAAGRSGVAGVSGTGVSPRPLNADWLSPSVACVAASSSAFVTVVVAVELEAGWRCGVPSATVVLTVLWVAAWIVVVPAVWVPAGTVVLAVAVAVAAPAPATGTPIGAWPFVPARSARLLTRASWLAPYAVLDPAADIDGVFDLRHPQGLVVGADRLLQLRLEADPRRLELWRVDVGDVVGDGPLTSGEPLQRGLDQVIVLGVGELHA